MVTLILFYFSFHSPPPSFVFHCSSSEGNLVCIQYILNNQQWNLNNEHLLYAKHMY